jgi:pimeloyl-ACP methyl ester carboxylesterase
VRQEEPVDGFRLTFERAGRGPAVLLLHGWPGDRTDYRDVVPLVSAEADVVVPDLRGFGESDKHQADPAGQYSAGAQARSIAGLACLDGVGHFIPCEAPRDFAAAVLAAAARSGPR